MTEYEIIIKHGVTFLAQIARQGGIIFVDVDVETPAYGRHS